MKKPTSAHEKNLLQLFKTEFEKAIGPWPEGMTLKEFGQSLTHLYQQREAKRAQETIVLKQSGIKENEITKADYFFWWGINAASNRNLKLDWVKTRLQKAIEENDFNFFIRFGRELKRKPRQINFDKISFLLAFGWANWMGKIPPLSFFTDEALLEMLKIFTGNENLTFDQVRKARQRLRLEAKNAKIKGIRREGNRFGFVLVDKADS